MRSSSSAFVLSFSSYHASARHRHAPVTSSSPDSSCFRNTTRFPLNRPARRMSTVPGVMVDLFRGAFVVVRHPRRSQSHACIRQHRFHPSRVSSPSIVVGRFHLVHMLRFVHVNRYRRTAAGRTSAWWVCGPRAWAVVWARLPAHRTFRFAWRRRVSPPASWDARAASLRSWLSRPTRLACGTPWIVRMRRWNAPVPSPSQLTSNTSPMRWTHALVLSLLDEPGPRVAAHPIDISAEDIDLIHARDRDPRGPLPPTHPVGGREREERYRWGIDIVGEWRSMLPSMSLGVGREKNRFDPLGTEACGFHRYLDENVSMDRSRSGDEHRDLRRERERRE